jgi:outer membrane protein OmpA-like peptidoglycan-associated protein
MRSQICIRTAIVAGIAILGGCRGDRPSHTAHDDMSSYTLRVVTPIAEDYGRAATDDDTESRFDVGESPAITPVSGCGEVTVFFATDSAELDETSRKSLDELAACLERTGTRETIYLTGRADPRGTTAYNEELSRRRAEAAASYLEEKGVDGERFTIYARGEEGATEGMPRLWPVQRRATVEPSSDRPEE